MELYEYDYNNKRKHITSYILTNIYFLMVSLLLGFITPMDEDDEDDMADLSKSCLSSLNALIRTSWSSMYLCLFNFRSSGVSFPTYASCDISSSSIILLRTFEQRGKKRFPSSTAQVKEEKIRHVYQKNNNGSSIRLE